MVVVVGGWSLVVGWLVVEWLVVVGFWPLGTREGVEVGQGTRVSA